MTLADDSAYEEMPMTKLNALLLAVIAAFAVACVEAEPEPRRDDNVVVVDEDTNEDTNQPDADTRPVAVAALDNDNAAQPARDEFLSITGTRQLIHSDEISYPAGDQADFVRFELPNNSNSSQRVTFSLDCAIDGQPDAIVRAVVTEDGKPVGFVTCNEGPRDLTVNNTQVQDVQITFASVNAATYVDYTLTVSPF